MVDMVELLHNMCRLCLKHIGHRNLFVEPKLICVVAQCTGIRLNPEATFPHTVCDKCLEWIRICKAFRKMVAKSERKLNQLKATNHHLQSEEFIKINKCTKIAEFEEPKQKKKTKHKSVQTSNAQESYSVVVESINAATQTMFCAQIVPSRKHMESSQQDLEESSDQSSNSCYEQQRFFFKEKLSKKQKKKNHILSPKSIFEQNIECMKSKHPEKSLHMVLNNSPQHTINEEVDLLSTHVDIERNISSCRKKNYRSIHDFSEDNLAGNIHENAPDGESLSVVKSSPDIFHETKSSKLRNKCEFIQELVSEENPCVNIEREPLCIARNIRLDPEEVKQEICEKPNKQKEEYKQKCTQENNNTGKFGILFVKKEYQYETEGNSVQPSALKPEVVIDDDNHHSIKTDMITSNSKVSEFNESLVMHSESQRQKMVYDCDKTYNDDKLEYSFKKESLRNSLNDIGRAFKVKIGVSPRLKQKYARKCVQQIPNADDSIHRIHERAAPATEPIYDEGQSHVEVKMKEDLLCCSDSKMINEKEKQSLLDNHTGINISNDRNIEEQDLAQNIKKQVQVKSVQSHNLSQSFLNGVSKSEDDFMDETPLPKKKILQRKVKQEKNYTESKVYTESEDSDYEVHLKKSIKRSKNIADHSIKRYKDSKENSTISLNSPSVIKKGLDISDLAEKTKKVHKSKELVCKKCEPLKIFTTHKEYKIHTYLHMRINRFC